MSVKPILGVCLWISKLGIILITLVLSACSDAEQAVLNTKSEQNDLLTLRLGTTRSPPSWLVHIAQAKGYFKQQGLDVVSTNYKSGKRALKAMLNNEVDLATTAEGPVVFYSFIRDDFSIVSTIGIASNDNLILARKDADINVIADLKGKAIATQVASSAHYYLYLFLAHNTLSELDIIQSYMAIDKLPDAIISGVADAVAIREPFFSKAKKRLGKNAIVFETPGLYKKSFLLAASNDYIDNNPENLSKFIAALLLAEQFVAENKKQAIQLLVSIFTLSTQQVRDILQYLDLTLSLDSALLVKLEDEANWVVNSKLTDSRDLPQYRDFINATALFKAKPAAVSFSRSQ